MRTRTGRRELLLRLAVMRVGAAPNLHLLALALMLMLGAAHRLPASTGAGAAVRFTRLPGLAECRQAASRPLDLHTATAATVGQHFLTLRSTPPTAQGRADDAQADGLPQGPGGGRCGAGGAPAAAQGGGWRWRAGGDSWGLVMATARAACEPTSPCSCPHGALRHRHVETAMAAPPARHWRQQRVAGTLQQASIDAARCAPFSTAAAASSTTLGPMLQAVNDVLSNEHPYCGGTEPNAWDLALAPRVYIARVGCQELKAGGQRAAWERVLSVHGPSSTLCGMLHDLWCTLDRALCGVSCRSMPAHSTTPTSA